MVKSYRGIIPSSSSAIDEPFLVNSEYINDCYPNKVNLGIGVYRTDEGTPWPLSVVEEVEQSLQARKDASRHEYLTIQGDLRFLELSRDLAFDFSSNPRVEAAKKMRITSVQTVSGTGANHIGARFLSDVLKPKHVWLPDPTWGNHFAIWELVGVEVRTYPYYSEKLRGVNIAGIMRTLELQAKRGDVILLHACAHNPTGSDPSKEQWMKLAELCDRLGLVPFFDLAYQGFASGDVSKDAWAIKHFFNTLPNLEFCVAQSFSKNFGLYGQRTGALHVVVGQDSVPFKGNVLSTLSHLIRGEYSVAPRAGSDIVRTTLGDPCLRQKWKEDLSRISTRIMAMRRALYDELVRLQTPGCWIHIIQQVCPPTQM